MTARTTAGGGWCARSFSARLAPNQWAARRAGGVGNATADAFQRTRHVHAWRFAATPATAALSAIIVARRATLIAPRVGFARTRGDVARSKEHAGPRQPPIVLAQSRVQSWVGAHRKRTDCAVLRRMSTAANPSCVETWADVRCSTDSAKSSRTRIVSGPPIARSSAGVRRNKAPAVSARTRTAPGRRTAATKVAASSSMAGARPATIVGIPRSAGKMGAVRLKRAAVWSAVTRTANDPRPARSTRSAVHANRTRETPTVLA